MSKKSKKTTRRESMPCPQCDSPDTKVIRTRVVRRGYVRVMNCVECGEQFETVENEFEAERYYATGLEDIRPPCNFNCHQCPHRDCVRSGFEILLFEAWVLENYGDEDKFLEAVDRGEIPDDLIQQFYQGREERQKRLEEKERLEREIRKRAR